MLHTLLKEFRFLLEWKWFDYLTVLILIWLVACQAYLLYPFILGRLGRKSCSYTMCKSHGHSKIYIFLDSQLRQASWSSSDGDQTLYREVSPRFRPEPRCNSVMWLHAGIILKLFYLVWRKYALYTYILTTMLKQKSYLKTLERYCNKLDS